MCFRSEKFLNLIKNAPNSTFVCECMCKSSKSLQKPANVQSLITCFALIFTLPACTNKNNNKKLSNITLHLQKERFQALFTAFCMNREPVSLSAEMLDRLCQCSNCSNIETEVVCSDFLFFKACCEQHN